ncbi:MAG TPA: sugar ABC transporter ATP-binding protein [Polyangiaceae bacterium]|nr:sugar ABC transporter ATP-binding protein [Polyangiaceae bacterium]
MLELVNIEKSFGGVRALRGANLSVRSGEIMGLCGENGAGKSTLLKVLSGAHHFGTYTGELIVDGRARQLRGPGDARASGIAVVHQELMLVPELSVAQNLLLGREPRRFGFLDEARLEAEARTALARFGWAEQIDVNRPVRELGIGLQQIVEIVRALSLDARILVLDEPTAALSGREAKLFMSWLESLRQEGTTCVYVSHRLDEVFELCDRVTVLRDGRTAATFVTSEVTPERVVAEMVGRDLELTARALAFQANGARPVLSVENFGVIRAAPAGERKTTVARAVLSGVSFSLQPGEIVAVCGVLGSGRTALLSSLFGCARAGTRGEVRVDGQLATLDSPSAAIDLGFAFVPEDRKAHGLILDMTVAENLALPSLASTNVMGPRARVGLVDSVAEALLAERRIRSLHIRGDKDAAVSTLSGGNQQKVVLGKWLEQPPKVLLLDEPTRGVDVGARAEIYGILEGLAARGVAVLFASSDLTEVVRLAQRVLVLRDGELVAELCGDDVSEPAIVRLSSAANSGLAAETAAE